ncbi:hypothetical protein KBD69_00195 [Candidatus Woesebacteria bacterium]|nr:hypothetical protein [Candidatus Woesebacteria bacterium]
MSLDDAYRVLTDDKFNKWIKKNLPTQLKKVLDKKIAYLASNPQHPSLNTKKYGVSQQTLKQSQVDEIWEFRINMNFRCVYYVVHSEKTIILAFVGNHEDVKVRFE